MELISVRPRLMAFRATRYEGDIATEPAVPLGSKLQIKQKIDVALVPAEKTKTIDRAIVRIAVHADVINEDGTTVLREHAFQGEYEGKFAYPESLAAADLEALFAQEPHQYLLVAQVFPLAMTHFRQQLLGFGVRVNSLPLGIADGTPPTNPTRSSRRRSPVAKQRAG